MFNASWIKQERGNTVIIFLFIMATLSAIAVGALQVTQLNLESSHAQRKGKKAYYAAEVGLDLAINDIISTFENLSVYTTTALNGGDGEGYLTQSNYRGYDVKYRITNPQARYLYETVQGNSILVHYAYTYNIDAISTSLGDNTTETLNEQIRILETPLVQWFAFYGGNGGNDSDLEITPGPGMTVWGRVHTNGDMWLRAGGSGQLHIQNFDPNGGSPIAAPHSLTAAGIIRNWHKGQNAVAATSPLVEIENTDLVFDNNLAISSNIALDADEVPYQDFVFVNEPIIQAPGNSQFVRGGFYDQRAGNPQRPDVDGIRITGTVAGGDFLIEVSRPGIDTDVTALVLGEETSAGTAYVGPGSGAIPIGSGIVRETLGVLNDCREGDAVDTTDIDLWALESWYEAYLADGANGGGILAGSGFLVYASRSPNAAFLNTGDPMQGIRLMQLEPTSARQLVDETTFATDNPLYIDGDFNNNSTKGAALIGDAINFLGNNWNDTKVCGVTAPSAGAGGTTQIEVRAALFGGYSPTTAPGGTYGGGLHNYMRYHERWNTGTDVTADFKGALIGLWVSQQATGNWAQGGDRYQPPIRNWGWDTRFADPDFWPPFIPSIFGVERVGFLE